MIRFLPIVLLPVGAVAQNLVVNPGFEETKSEMVSDNDCFSRSGVEGWFTPNVASTDYFLFTPGDAYAAMQTVSFGGTARPHEGNAFAGFIAWNKPYEYREYIGGTFSQPLVSGKTYEISFSLMLGKECLSGVDALGLYAEKEKETDIRHHFALKDRAPLATIKTTSNGDPLGNWVTVSERFVAKGGEQYFLLGNFSDDQQTLLLPGKAANSTGFSWAYYYVDDISVQPADVPLQIISQITNATDIAAGKTLVAQNIYFETDKATLLAPSYPPLYAILGALKNQPDLHVEIDGHTDSTGTSAHNQQLSDARAKAVAQFLTSNGITANRISWKGYGESKPISDDNNKNRRVEFVFSDQ